MQVGYGEGIVMSGSDEALAGFVTETAGRFGVAGAAVGVWHGGREVFASHGVTSVENPLPVTQHTLFLIASVTKTFTATAVMRLVADGKIALDAPVRRYVPELVLADERTADQVTVLNLLNHTSGLDWGVIGDFGEGDDALARYVSALAGLTLIAPPGTRASYSQAGFNLAGRIVEKVTGLTYEKAVASLVFSPAGLPGSFFDRDDVMTRRFAVGHNRGEDGTVSIGRLSAELPGDHRPGSGAAALRRGARPGGRRELRERGHDVHHRDRRGRPADGPEDGGPDQAGDPGGGGPAPFEVGLLPRDEYIVTGGEYAGQRGFFTRDASGEVTGVDLAGRLASRV